MPFDAPGSRNLSNTAQVLVTTFQELFFLILQHPCGNALPLHLRANRQVETIGTVLLWKTIEAVHAYYFVIIRVYSQKHHCVSQECPEFVKSSVQPLCLNTGVNPLLV